MDLRTRLLNALTPSAFASAGTFDCPVCGGRQEVHVSVYANPNPSYLFNLGVFCDCGPERVLEKIGLRAKQRRRQ
jgi:hypothetical protein